MIEWKPFINQKTGIIVSSLFSALKDDYFEIFIKIRGKLPKQKVFVFMHFMFMRLNVKTGFRPIGKLDSVFKSFIWIRIFFVLFLV